MEQIQIRSLASSVGAFYRISEELYPRSADMHEHLPPTYADPAPQSSLSPIALFEDTYERNLPAPSPYYDVSLDGQRLLMITGTWHEELKRLVPVD